jgi:hypothetical protein
MKTELIIKRLFATFPNANATAATGVMYVERLGSIPPEELEIVINECIDRSEFLPTIARIKEMHRQLHNPVPVDGAQAGWESVQKAILGVGTWGAPKFKDPIVKRVVDSFGWLNLCLSENQMADRAQFIKFYDAFARQEADERSLSAEFKQLRAEHSGQDYLDAEPRSGGEVKRISEVLNGGGYNAQ